jgi:hypothetical protein
MGVWNFIQNQILGMKWLNAVIGSLLSSLGLDTASRWGGSVQFFLYDVIKITILLCLLIFIISYIQSYFPPERSKKILGRFHGLGRQLHRGAAGHGDAVLLLLLHPAVHRLYQRRPAGGRDVFLPDLLPDGRSRQPRAADEHFRREGRRCLCDLWPDRGGHRRHDH